MPCHSSGRTVRARRPRPSEKTAFRVIWGLSPVGHPSSDDQSPGGAGSARPQGRRQTSPNVASSRPPAHRKRTGENAMPRLESGLARRTHGVHPSEKIALRVTSWFSSEGHPSSGDQSPGGAGSARPEGTHTANPNVASSWPSAHRKRTGGNAMPRLESGLARRTHGVRPSEETAFCAISGPSTARPSCPGWPPRGGAGSARPQMRFRSTGGSPH